MTSGEDKRTDRLCEECAEIVLFVYRSRVRVTVA